MLKILLFLLSLANYSNCVFDGKILIEHVLQSISKAENEMSKLPAQVLKLEGMSSAKVRHLLNNICSLSNASYLEIGVWKGSTLISSLFGNTHNINHAIAIDNWSEFAGPREEFINNFSRFLSGFRNTFKLYDQDCFKIDLGALKSAPIDIYFYDGNHTAESQRLAFTYYNEIFSNVFIAIIDDWNYPPVPEGTYQAFKELNYTILYEKTLPARFNGDTVNWWNGLYIAVIKKN